MHVPKHFTVDDRQTVLQFIRSHPFGVLVSSLDGKPFATHVPFVILQTDPQLLLGSHIARVNPQWREIEGAEALAIFHGAHGHISAAWYEAPGETVPTWNYAAVHCSGRARIASAQQTRAIIEQLVAEHEGAEGWRMDLAAPEYIARMMQGIVGIEIAAGRIDAQFKYSQNRTAEDRRRVIARLAESSAESDRQLSGDMTAYYAREAQR